MIHLIHIVVAFVVGVASGYGFRGFINREGKVVEAKVASKI